MLGLPMRINTSIRVARVVSSASQSLPRAQLWRSLVYLWLVWFPSRRPTGNNPEMTKNRHCFRLAGHSTAMPVSGTS